MMVKKISDPCSIQGRKNFSVLFKPLSPGLHPLILSPRHRDQANLEQNEYKYELELEELQKVESRIAALQPEYDGVMKKRQLAEERKKEMARQLKLKTRAALIAQAWWRGYCVRKAMAGKKKGKKDKKQKGKKK